MMEYILSKSGRKMSLPKNKFYVRLGTSNRKVINDLKIIDQWLIDQSIEECRVTNDDWGMLFVRDLNIKNLSQSDFDTMNFYIFGELDPDIEILSD